MAQQSEMRVLTNKKGQTVETAYSDQEAFNLLEDQVKQKIASPFAYSLVTNGKRFGLTDEQFWWIHKLVNPQKPKTLMCERIRYSFSEAVNRGAKLRFLKVIVDSNDGIKLGLSLASERSKHRGVIFVTDGIGYPSGKTYGKIDESGVFSGFETPEVILNFLSEVNENVERFLAW